MGEYAMILLGFTATVVVGAALLSEVGKKSRGAVWVGAAIIWTIGTITILRQPISSVLSLGFLALDLRLGFYIRPWALWACFGLLGGLAIHLPLALRFYGYPRLTLVPPIVSVLVITVAALAAPHPPITVTPPVQPPEPPPVTPPDALPTTPGGGALAQPAGPAKGEQKLNKYAKATASSVGRDGKVLYRPENTLDGKEDTTWAEGAMGDGAGQWVQYDFDRPMMLTRFGAIPGYRKFVNDKVGDRFKANNRVADATLSWAGGSRKVHFEDRAALQSFDLPKVSTPFIRLTINSVYKGNRFADTSISEVVIYGHPAAGTAPSAPTGGIATPAWVICVAAYDGKEQAEARAKKLREIGGFPAGVLWIPDYASLSGAKKWLAYAGPVPYGDRPAAESLLSKVKGWGIDAYAIKVDTSPGREEFR